ncbi:alpha/beta hydrolase [Simiduia curdlanivorans]|uniref:Alpha/beta fold hydrolase n=1 Tax=Simiduia curdlanivorans TaxID=1492769 RepID=A0ABV8V5V0_9GAMM|nr:alpha/beta hydrolase [Simiduia curdlanivorans]MDN3637448.1 alpha/beta hydrolase [Simiduia curdlanivorans]
MDSDQWYASGEQVQLLGHQIFYRQSGNSRTPSLVLIHGFPTSSWDWASLWPALEQRYHLIALDLLGFGHSDKPRQHQYALLEQASIVEALLKHLDINECHLLAHDYGDSVVQELLARQQLQQAKVVYRSACFLNGGLFPETHRTLLIQKLLLGPFGWLVNRCSGRGQFKRSFVKVFAHATRPSDEVLDQFWNNLCYGGGQSQLYRLMRYITDRRVNRQRWLAPLQHSPIPLALINGSVDPVSGAHLVQRYKYLACRLDFLSELADVGHYPQLEAPQRVLDAFFAFHDQIEL